MKNEKMKVKTEKGGKKGKRKDRRKEGRGRVMVWWRKNMRAYLGLY